MAMTETLPTSPTFVVGIGASAGGLEALERLFKAMPLDSGMAFVVIQHLSPDYKSLMDELMARFTKLAVVRVGDAVEVRPNTVFLLPPSKEMVMDRDRLVLVDRLHDQPVHLPITRFFRSLAHAWGDRSIAIVLSGTGSDGSSGLRDVHAAGGLVLAQSELTAKFDGMPRAAVATGLVDQVLAPEAMPACLLRFAADPAATGRDDGQAANTVEPGHGAAMLIERLRDSFGIDFGLYKSATISRRIQRRMEFGHFANIDDYCRRAISDPAELDEMCRDLLIGVTRFFRDPEAFELLRERIIPEVVASVPVNEDVRLWVPACATGEEAYSLAILFSLELERLGRGENLRVFASDVHRDSLRIASDGIYTEDSLENVPLELRDRFFLREHDGRFRVAGRLRKRVLFSAHNVLKDVPFNRIDLVSCRNLLIYFLPEAQRRALAAFYFALKLHGSLVLGPSETAGELDSYFETVDRTWKVYRKAADIRLPLDVQHRPPPLIAPAPTRGLTGSDGRLLRAYDALLERFMPPGVLVNDRREQVHVFGDGNRFLRPPSGRASLDLVAMCEGDLRVAVSAALSSASKRRERVEVHGVRVGGVIIDVVVEPVDDSATGSAHFLVRFVEASARSLAAGAVEAPFVVQDDGAARLRQLETEAQDARESFHNMLEEFEATNEELQASNEELIAGNEELQSTNEELQSVNEELHSVNAEYNQKIHDLAAASADLRNLVAVSHAGVIFTDRRQVIRLYTPGAAKVLNLMAQDVGRPLAHITSRIEGDDIFDDLRQVEATRAPAEKILVLADDRVYLRRIQAYEDGDGMPAGFVITFTDHTERQRAERAQAQRHALIKAIIDASASQIAVVDQAGVVITSNHAWEHVGGAAPVGRGYLDDRVASAGDPAAAAAHALVADVLAGRQASGDLDYACPSPTELRWFWMNVAALPATLGGAVITHTEITTRKRAAELEQKLNDTAKLESLGILAGGIAHDFNNLLTGILANTSLVRMDLPRGAPAAGPLAEVHQAAVRAAELCQQMLAFSGRGRIVAHRIEVPALVRETATLIRASLARQTRLELELESGTPAVEVDASQLQQVVMNLALNGSEALPADGGVVRIQVGQATPGVEPDELEVVAATRIGQVHAALVVSDDGCGIAKDDLKRIFEPFYTTKFTGRGLGLAAALGIVRGHAGAMYVRSAPGAGTRFRVLIPAAAAAATVAAVTEPIEVIRAPVDGATVLVVDDEEIVRRAVARILERAGYGCVLAGSGTEALAQVAAAPDRFGLALLDLTMPGIDGVDTFHKLRAMAPALKVLLMSGYSTHDTASRFGEERPTGFVQKPVTARSLAEAVRVALGDEA